jgi:membrane-bound lytic murein transglycosylase C
MNILIVIFLLVVSLGGNEVDINLLKTKYNNLISQNQKYYQKTIDDNRRYYTKIVSSKWGKNNVKFSNKKNFVQYSKNFRQREIIDYEKGRVTLELLGNKRPSVKEIEREYNLLRKQSILQNAKNDPLLEDMKIAQIENIISNSKIIKSKRFSVSDIHKKYINKNTIYYVNVSLVDNYMHRLANYYMKDILHYATKYNIRPSYILAIIQTESAFNPNAISHIPAFGLMQIVPNTAGKDVKYYLTGWKTKPTKTELMNPSKNILMGTTYIKIIQSKYLSGVKNKENLYLATSTSYNAGIGSLYRSLTGSSRNKTKAFKIINNKTPNELYNHLRYSSSLTQEARNYVRRVKRFSDKWKLIIKKNKR